MGDIMSNTPNDLMIVDSILVAGSKINHHVGKIMCSISGGSDSDIVIDLLQRTKNPDKIYYVFFNTGLEYEATKKHLKYLEEKYNIKIHEVKAQKPIPTCTREFGEPFVSKQVSEMIQRLQRHGFKWENKSYDELVQKYPKCKAALRWWCNAWGEKSKFNIDYNKGLKEFMLQNPPKFKISNKCCHFTKKKLAKDFKTQNDINFSITGIRKAEGGARSAAYKNCFSADVHGVDEYRPIFWYKEEDKRIYEQFYNIKHSDCYEKYGLKRTGCAGCPYGKDFENELEVIHAFEPKLFTAVNKIFKNSYEYTRAYKDFVQEKYGKSIGKQLNMFEIFREQTNNEF